MVLSGHDGSIRPWWFHKKLAESLDGLVWAMMVLSGHDGSVRLWWFYQAMMVLSGHDGSTKMLLQAWMIHLGPQWFHNKLAASSDGLFRATVVP